MVSTEHIKKISSYLDGLEQVLKQQNLKKEAEKVNGFNGNIKSGEITHDYLLGIFFYNVYEILNSVGSNIKELAKKILPDDFEFITSKYEPENGMNIPKTTRINGNLELEDIVAAECCWILDSHRPSISFDFDDTIINFKSPLGMYLESLLYYMPRGRVDHLIFRTTNLLVNRAAQLKEKGDDLPLISAMVKEARDLPVYLMEKTLAETDINPTMAKLVNYIRNRFDFRNDEALYIQVVTRSDPYTVYMLLNSDKVKRKLEQLTVVVSQIVGNKWEKKIVEPCKFLWFNKHLPERMLVYTGRTKVVVPSKKKCLLSLNGNSKNQYAIFIPETQVYLPTTKVLVCDYEDHINNKKELPTVMIDRKYNHQKELWKDEVNNLIVKGEIDYGKLTDSLSRT